MSTRPTIITDDLYGYLASVSLREPAILTRLREETAADSMARMQVAPEQGQFMALLVALMAARRILEVGTYTGYSTLWMALALPPQGKIVTCDRNEEWASVARRYWAEARVANRIELRLGDALGTLDGLLAEGQERKFDMVFIDADKENYIGYYEYSLKLLRSGGLVLVDNILWHGKVLEPELQDAETVAIRTFNHYLRNDHRVTLSMVPLGDGLALAMKN